MMFLIIIASIFTGFGVYHLSCAFVDVPTAKTSKMMLLSRKQKGAKGEKLLDVYITRIASYFEKYVKLDMLKKSKLQIVLNIAGIKVSPEVYVLKAYVTSALTVICAIPVFFIHPLFFLVIVGLAVTLWFAAYYAAFDFVKKRKKIIEAEIPRLAMAIAQNLENDRDVLKILISYRRIAGKEMAYELDQTIADMKTGNYENALLRFESRVNSTLLSDIIRGLIGTLRGDDQHMYFKMICFDMRQIEQNNLKKETAKRPKQIQKYSMFMLICIIIIYAVVLSTEVISSLGVFFH